MTDHFQSTGTFLTHSLEMSPQQKAAKVTMLLMEGRRLSARQVSDMFGFVERAGGQAMLENISYAIPIYEDHSTGQWQWVDSVRSGRWRSFNNT